MLPRCFFFCFSLLVFWTPIFACHSTTNHPDPIAGAMLSKQCRDFVLHPRNIRISSSMELDMQEVGSKTIRKETYCYLTVVHKTWNLWICIPPIIVEEFRNLLKAAIKKTHEISNNDFEGWEFDGAQSYETVITIGNTEKHSVFFNKFINRERQLTIYSGYTTSLQNSIGQENEFKN